MVMTTLIDKNDSTFIVFYTLLLVYLVYLSIHTFYDPAPRHQIVSVRPMKILAVESTPAKTVPEAPIAAENVVAETVPAEPVPADTVTSPAEETKKGTVSSVADGGSIAKKNCLTCHATGLMNAPKLGDEADWNKRHEKGFESLLSNALNGYKSMPARGGNTSLGDEEVRIALLYILESSGIDIGAYAIETVASVPETAAGDTADQPATADETDEQVAGGQAVTGEEPGQTTDAKVQAIVDPADVGNTRVLYAVNRESTGNEQQASETYNTSESSGNSIYAENCAQCHDDGTNGAQIIGNQKDWIETMSKGIDEVVRQIEKDSTSHAFLDEKNLSGSQVSDAINFIMKKTFWPDP